MCVRSCVICTSINSSVVVSMLVDFSCILQIADFGMSRNLQDETYYKSTNKRIPVKWTAPEVL